MITASRHSAPSDAALAGPMRRLGGWVVDMMVIGPVIVVGTAVWGLLQIIDQGFWCRVIHPGFCAGSRDWSKHGSHEHRSEGGDVAAVFA